MCEWQFAVGAGRDHLEGGDVKGEEVVGGEGEEGGKVDGGLREGGCWGVHGVEGGGGEEGVRWACRVVKSGQGSYGDDFWKCVVPWCLPLECLCHREVCG